MQSQEYLDLLDKVLERVQPLVEDMKALHIRKANGYSGVDEPDTWKNFRGASDYGATPFQGCMIRESDKTARIKSLLKNPEVAGDESIEDTLMDRAAYNLIAICLYRRKSVAGSNGINVPADEACVWQDYKDSTVEEYYLSARERDARVSQLLMLDRNPMTYFAHKTRRTEITEVYVVRWVEPRGVER